MGGVCRRDGGHKGIASLSTGQGEGGASTGFAERQTLAVEGQAGSDFSCEVGIVLSEVEGSGSCFDGGGKIRGIGQGGSKSVEDDGVVGSGVGGAAGDG